jgi:hypothetical protein
MKKVFLQDQIDKPFYNPTVYMANGVYESKTLLFDKTLDKAVFIDRKTCQRSNLQNLCNRILNTSDIKLDTAMINPTLYSITITQQHKNKSMLLVLQHTFHSGWKVLYNKRSIAEDKHILVNGYANGWFLEGNDIPQKNKFTVYIQLDPQKYFYYGWFVTILFLVITIILLVFSFIQGHEKN